MGWKTPCSSRAVEFASYAHLNPWTRCRRRALLIHTEVIAASYADEERDMMLRGVV